MIDRIIIRPLGDADAIPPITKLLHEAYAPLAAMDLRYTATHQSDEVTRARFTRGLPWVAVLEDEIVATVTLYPVMDGDSGCAWYGRPGVFSFGQFAVRPDLQAQGLGGKLIALLENEAAPRGGAELARNWRWTLRRERCTSSAGMRKWGSALSNTWTGRPRTTAAWFCPRRWFPKPDITIDGPQEVFKLTA
jgi:predicted N-acetyltransferase YhbS